MKSTFQGECLGVVAAFCALPHTKLYKLHFLCLICMVLYVIRKV